MKTSRLEAFSDGVVAILITIMVLELRKPEGVTWEHLGRFLSSGSFRAYVLSFIFLGIYWNNHHHMLHMVSRVTGGILWANLHLLFWLSLVPMVTDWMGDVWHAPTPTAVYGIVLLLSAIAYYILQQTIIRTQGHGSALKAAVGRDLKGRISPLIYATAIAISFVEPWISQLLYLLVALMWLVPDRRIEKHAH
jgi:uncharacterized membrane protein